MTDLRYPIGTFYHHGPITPDELETWLRQIEALPEQVRQAITWLSDAQLNTPYRPGGWTLRQVLHHLPDSHLNSYIRFKWALTEEEPLIKTYDETLWAELADCRETPVETSLDLLTSLHERWVVLLRNLSAEQLSRRFIHPRLGPVMLAYNVGLYAWHGRHHLAHITSTIERHGWQLDVEGAS